MQHQETNRATSKTRITLPTGNMTRVKSVSGGVSFHCGDRLAKNLQGLPLAHVKAIATTFGLDVAKYAHLNPGQQRMNIGNLIRSAVRRNEELAATLEDAVQGVRESFDREQAKIAEQKAAERAEREARRAEARKANEDAKAARKAEREARAAAKTE